VALLRRGESIMMAQDKASVTGARRMFCQGRLRLSLPAIRLAHRSGAVILPVTVARECVFGRVRIEFEPPISPGEGCSVAEDEQKLLAYMQKSLRENPSAWDFWYQLSGQ
jgi:lauroyl/myristoyl acyltransferase